MNQLLERALKVYIKTVTCYPEKTNPETFDRFWKQFKHSEKVQAGGNTQPWPANPVSEQQGWLLAFPPPLPWGKRCMAQP